MNLYHFWKQFLPLRLLQGSLAALLHLGFTSTNKVVISIHNFEVNENHFQCLPIFFFSECLIFQMVFISAPSVFKGPHTPVYACFQSLISNKRSKMYALYIQGCHLSFAALFQKFDRGILAWGCGWEMTRSLSLCHEESFLVYLWISWLGQHYWGKHGPLRLWDQPSH